MLTNYIRTSSAVSKSVFRGQKWVIFGALS
jgi:hypothetical protein